MKRIKELRSKGIEEIKKLLDERRNAIRKDRFDVATKQVKNSRQLRNEKRNVARMLTLIKESEKNGK